MSGHQERRERRCSRDGIRCRPLLPAQIPAQDLGEELETKLYYSYQPVPVAEFVPEQVFFKVREEPEKFPGVEVVEERRLVFGPAALSIVILDAQQHPSAARASRAPNVDGIHHVAQVQVARRSGRKTRQRRHVRIVPQANTRPRETTRCHITLGRFA